MAHGVLQVLASAACLSGPSHAPSPFYPTRRGCCCTFASLCPWKCFTAASRGSFPWEALRILESRLGLPVNPQPLGICESITVAFNC